MSIHPSLSASKKEKKQRTVLKRIERLKVMSEKGLWKEGDSVYGLPKIKTIRIKIKKEKVAKAETTALTAEATAETLAAETKTQPAAKAPTAKPEKK